MTPAAIAIVLFVTLVITIIGLGAVRGSTERRLALEYAAHDGRSRRRLDVLRPTLNRAVGKTQFGTDLDRRLQGATVRLGPGEFITIVAGVAVLLVILLFPMMGYLGSIVVFGGTFAAALRWLDKRRQARVDAFIAQLPDIARVMGGGATAGLAIRSSIELVARELPEPAAGEFGEVAREMALGRSLDGALASLDERLPSRELSVLTRTLLIQSTAGGKLATTLSNIAATLDARRELRREVATMTSAASFSGYMVVAIGVGSVFVMNLITPGSLDKLASNLIGQGVLLVAGVMFCIGFFLMRRISRVEV
ncbi:type II secretion system F family protein [Luteipulveratus halotolerans]|uniref:type II secretion system F family protein n=1 Tax=Luteipulveratus halotolerans TaxID=1631356 RepID=UPI0006819B22|nr:type II secretion system F family protein [Luteipulveratus halotolerans]